MRKFGACMAVIAMMAPSTLSAVTAEELQAQLSVLLQQADSLKSGTEFRATLGSGDCPKFTRTMQLGSRGADVSELQEFLAQDPTVYPEALVTGYFGQLTVNAVQRWQAIHGVVTSGTPLTTGYGVVGPKTRAEIAESCTVASASSAPPVSATIKASPASGDAPLPVVIQVAVNTSNSCNAEIYTLDFGDGTPPQPIPTGAGICAPQSLTLTHLYRYGGQFQLSIGARDHRTSTPIAVYGPTITGAIATSGPPSQTSAQTSVNVQMTDNTFSPSTFTVGPGVKVTWTNLGQTVHTVTSDDGAFDSGPIEPGKSHSFIFDQVGTYRYHCKNHGAAGGSGMSGLIIVTQKAQQNNQSFAYDEPEVSQSASAITLDFRTRGSCDGYSIDWGDGSDPVYRGGDGGQCGSPSLITLAHNYTRQGTFTITLSRGPGLYHTDTPKVTIQ